MFKVKVIGAGSIGNHLANASRAMGWDVVICDIDAAALERTRNDIYPGRYGVWDENIQLFLSSEAPKGGFDLIFVGTPPDSHMDLAIAAIDESPKVILIEKPLSGPGLERSQEFVEKATAAGIKAFVGYDHVVGSASQRVGELIAEKVTGRLETLDVEIREHWGGIFGAHPWLDGPKDTYLGYWKRGGGSCGEHSHGINLWQHFARLAGAGRIVEVSAVMDYVQDGEVDYDRLCLMNVKTENGLVGRIVQDVVTKPPRKWARLQGENGHIDWYCNRNPGEDAVCWTDGTVDERDEVFAKTRPDDFILELKHIDAVLNGGVADSGIALERGMDTMLIIAAAHQSAATGKTVLIDYSKGYIPEALKTA